MNYSFFLVVQICFRKKKKKRLGLSLTGLASTWSIFNKVFKNCPFSSVLIVLIFLLSKAHMLCSELLLLACINFEDETDYAPKHSLNMAFPGNV